MITTLIFDVYGTLLNTRSCSLVVLQDVMDRCRCRLRAEDVYKKWREKIEEMIGLMDTKKKFRTERVFFKTAMNKAFGELYLNASAHGRMRLYNEMCWGRRSIFPDTKPAIKKLRKKYFIVIASNSDTKPLMTDLKRHKIKVDKVITSEMLRIYKPHRKFFEDTLKAINKKPGECIYIGDSLKSDVFGSKQIGLRSILVNRKNKIIKKYPKPGFIVKKLTDIEKVIKQKAKQNPR